MLIIDAVTGGIVDANAAATRLLELPDAFGSTTLADCLSVFRRTSRADLEDAAKTGNLTSAIITRHQRLVAVRFSFRVVQCNMALNRVGF